MRRLRLTSKLGVVLLALAACLLVLAGGSRDWVGGTVNDPVLGASQVGATGTQAAPGLSALALVAAAAAVAAVTSGLWVRRVALVALAGAGVGLGYLSGRIIVDPSGVMGGVAAHTLGRTGSVAAHGWATTWPWLGLVAALALLVAAGAGWAGSRTWRGLGARYETQGATATGARGQRVASDWDRLDAGDDPTT